MTGEFQLSPALAITLLVVMLFSGRLFRDAWKLKAPGWQAKCWAFGVVSFAAFAVIAFVPMRS
ncbi:MAG: hypothetical protein K0U93_18040 [Gammaproteobacteria bacterium]|nr:hypothetical protein [Gammaproteobacteria bacterium]